MAKQKGNGTAPAVAAAANEPEADSDGLWTTRQAATYLGVQKSSFDAAIKRLDWLREGVITDKYPGLNIVRKRIHPDLVRRFSTDRGESGRGGSRGGQKKMAVFLTEDEVARAEIALSEEFGREVTFERLYRGKKADGDESGEGTEDTGGDEQNAVESYDTTRL